MNKKYPLSLFLGGFILNIIKTFYLFIPSIILLIIGLWNGWCLLIGLTLLIICMIYALAKQIKIRNYVTNDNDPDLKEWQDAITSHNWKDNIINLTKEKIEKDPNNKT